MQDFLYAQSEGADPLEFLKLSQGYVHLKGQVCKQ